MVAEPQKGQHLSLDWMSCRSKIAVYSQLLMLKFLIQHLTVGVDVAF